MFPMKPKIPTALLSSSVLCIFSVLPVKSATECEVAITAPVEFSCISWQVVDDNTFFVKDGGEYLPLDLKKGRRSSSLRVSTDDVLRLFIRNGEANGDYAEFASCQVPRGAAPLLVLLNQEGSDGKEGIQVDVIVDPASLFPQEGLVFVNLSGEALDVLVAGEAMSLASGESARTSKLMPNAGGFLGFYFKDNSNNTVYESRVYGQLRKRKLAFIYPPKAPGYRHSVKFITETLPK